MYQRVFVALFVLALGVTACGGDDDDSAGGVVDSCTAMTQSVPGSPADPCPQTDPKCPSATYMAVATCDTTGKWTKGADGAIACACLLKGGGAGNTGSPSVAAGAAMCGNGKIEKPEDCDGTALNNETCASMVAPGSTGMLTCNKTTCKFETTMCVAPSMSGMGGMGD